MPSFEIIMPKGIKDLEKNLDIANKKAPGKIIEGLDKQGRKIVRIARDGTPTSSKDKKKSKRLKYSYRAEPTTKEYGEWVKNIRNKARHIHLVKYGHKLKKGSKVIGTVRGVDYFEKAVRGSEAEIDKAYEKIFDNIMKSVFE